MGKHIHEYLGGIVGTGQMWRYYCDCGDSLSQSDWYWYICGRTKMMQEAILEYQKHNQLGNDLDAYLNALGKWALGESDEKPDASHYGVQNV